MKTTLLLSIISAAMLTFSGCGEKATQDATTNTETSTMKCEAGKCNADMKKVEKAGGKCGEGKCGGTPEKPVNTP